MVKGFDRDLVALLKDAGCYFVRNGKGSHAIWYSPITARNFTFPHGVASRHTANNVLTDAGLSKSF